MRQLFGTDGIRGVANRYPITPDMMIKIGRAIANVLKKESERPKTLIGKDTRLSGYVLENALTAGICSAGADVLLVGPIPTPAVAYLTKTQKADAGIVISASHNPYTDNGIKLFSNKGYKLPDEAEEEIEKEVEQENEEKPVEPSHIGKVYRIDDAKKMYAEFAKNAIKNKSLAGLKIVLDCANGAAYSVGPQVFKELGAKVIVLNNKPDGININKECGATYPEVIKRAVRENKADIGIALDGDADRAIFVDENSQEVDGDHVMAICAAKLKKEGKLNKNTLVATVMSNLGLRIAMKKQGIKIIETQVGDRYVAEEIRKGNYSLGGEQSGHIIFGDYSTTGDGIITALQVVSIMQEQGKKLSELAKIMDKLPQILINVEVKEKKPFEEIPSVIKLVEDAEKKLGNAGRILLRYSGTEQKARVMIEGENQEEIKQMAEKITDQIKKEIGK